MGQIADDMAIGLICQACGVYIDGNEPGYPRLCWVCKKEEHEDDERERMNDDERRETT